MPESFRMCSYVGMTPKLAELIAYCQDHGIKGSYGCSHDPPLWRARIRVGQAIYTGPADTRDEALERMAEGVLRVLQDPMPQHGTREYVEWEARWKGVAAWCRDGG